MFEVRVGEVERRLSRAALIDEVRAGKVPGEAAVSFPVSCDQPTFRQQLSESDVADFRWQVGRFRNGCGVLSEDWVKVEAKVEAEIEDPGLRRED